MTPAQIALLIEVHVGPAEGESDGQRPERGTADDLLALYRMQG